jgi:hypothetical protein
MSESRYTCACCGYQTLSERPGNWAICHVCFREDDPVQLLDPWYVGGANRLSLAEAQENYATIGASEARLKSNVRGVLAGDTKDPAWYRVTDADRSKVTSPARLNEEKPEWWLAMVLLDHQCLTSESGPRAQRARLTKCNALCSRLIRGVRHRECRG